MEAKQQIITAIQMWADSKIDTVMASHPRMAVIAPRLKQGIQNLIAKNDKNIENTLLFFTDQEGNLDVGNVFEEAIKAFEEMPITHKHSMGIDFAIGKGEVVARMPDNFFTSFLLGDTGALKLTGDDIMELKELLIK